jgi:murein DD-endopeptidase MepM/ murein hydrolase activator NlpD
MRGLLIFLAGAIFGAVAVYVAMVPATLEPPATTTPAETTASPVSPPMPVESSTSPPAASSAVAPETALSIPVAPSSQAPVSPTTLPPSAEPAASATLLIPVDGVRADQLSDTFEQARAAGRRHDAIDIMAPRGTHVLAAADGTVVKLFTSVRGGLTVYAFDPTSTIEYYYAHLDGYAPGLAKGMVLRRGDLVGFVGSTGDANPSAPHLHFEIAVLGPQKNWWQATDIDPYPVLTGRQTLEQAIAGAGIAKPSPAH